MDLRRGLAVASLPLLVSCVSFSDAGRRPEPRPPATERTAHVQVRSSGTIQGRDRPDETYELTRFPEWVERGVAESGAFAEVVPYSRLAEYEVLVRVHQDQQPHGVNLISLFSLFLVPSTQPADVFVTVEVARGRSVLASCRRERSFRVLFWLPAVVFTFTHSFAAVEEDLLYNLTRECMDDVQDELGWAS